MTNFEYYKEDILRLTRKENFAIIDGKLCNCDKTKCTKCKFYGGLLSVLTGTCVGRRYRWLYENYNPKVLNSKERAFCVLMGNGYIARDEDGLLFWYRYKPKRDTAHWDYSKIKRELIFVKNGFESIWVDLNASSVAEIHSKTKDVFAINVLSDMSFDFISWTDDEPYSVKDLLELAVEG